MSTSYQEQVWLNWWVWLIITIVVVASSTALLGRGNFGYAFERPPNLILYMFLLLDVIFVFVALNFRKVELQINQEGIGVRYGIIKKTISAEEIVSCKPARMRMPLYGGVGLRLSENDLPRYKAGNAVKITGKSGKTFLVPTNKPQEISRIINSISKP